MKAILAWLKQPSTLVALGVILGGVTYWFTGSGATALVVAGIVPGAVNDNTKGLIQRVETMEDAARPLVSEMK